MPRVVSLNVQTRHNKFDRGGAGLSVREGIETWIGGPLATTDVRRPPAVEARQVRQPVPVLGDKEVSLVGIAARVIARRMVRVDEIDDRACCARDRTLVLGADHDHWRALAGWSSFTLMIWKP